MAEKPIVLLVVLDSLGKDTIERYLSHSGKNVSLPNLERLGLGNVLKPEYHNHVQPCPNPELAFETAPRSAWADSPVGHRELAGYIDPEDYEIFYNGFPAGYIRELERRTGRPVLYNKRAGGMKAIEDNHSEHMKTGGLIVYSSMCDPLIQIAANEGKIGPGELAAMTETAFALALEQGIRINRAVARPYIVKDGEFIRTSNRHDVVAPLPEGAKTLIDVARGHGVHTVSVGKPAEVINTRWDRIAEKPGALAPDMMGMFTTPNKKDINPYYVMAALDELRNAMSRDKPTFIFCNLPDTDSLFGHNRLVDKCLDSLIAFDRVIPVIEKALPKDGFLIIAADHGMRDGGDYGYHNREPIAVLGEGVGTRVADRTEIPRSHTTYALVGYVCAQLLGFGNDFLESCKLREVLQ